MENPHIGISRYSTLTNSGQSQQLVGLIFSANSTAGVTQTQ